MLPPLDAEEKVEFINLVKKDYRQKRIEQQG
jgi:hypothetical protein